MKHYAVLDRDSKVTNIIVAASLEVAEQVTSSTCILVEPGTFVDMGLVYINGAFINPNVEEVPAEGAPTEEAPA